MPDFPVTTMKAEPFAYVHRTATMAEMPKVIGEGFAMLAGLFTDAKVAMGGPPFAHYLSYDNNAATFQLGFPVSAGDIEALRSAGLGIGETPGGRVMTATHIGPYDTLPTTYAAIAEAMKAQGLTGTTDMWECYFSPPETPPEQIRTDVIWPLR